MIAKTGALAIVIAAVFVARPALACSPWAEKVVAWDAKADAVVVAVWTERDKPPARPEKARSSGAGAGAQPNQYDLRRISTGANLSALSCEPATPGGLASACDWRAAFAKVVGAEAVWERRGPPLPKNALRVRSGKSEGGGQEFVVEARKGGKFTRLFWLDVIAKDYPERHRYRVGDSERIGGDVVIALEHHSRGGNCAHTAVQVFSFREADLVNPQAPDRHGWLLRRVRMDRPFGFWRTVAELGPLPPDRLVEALEIAEIVGEPALGARWWRAATRSLPAERRAALEVALEKNLALQRTRSLLADKAP